jgi:hypothetical protein
MIQKTRQQAVHVCEEIDKFQEDIIEGHLNKRGWVLQERVLARQTIYFANRQAYWQCGDGIRCESPTKMRKQVSNHGGEDV